MISIESTDPEINIDATRIADGSIDNTEFQYLDGLTSNIQAQLNGKQATITGGASTITSSNLTVSKALVSDTSGKVAASSVSSTELGYLSGVTSAVQTQINSKQATITGAGSSIVTSNLTASKVLVSDSSGKVAAGTPSSTEVGYLSGVTSAIQTQINAKQANITGGASSITTSNLTASKALVSDASGKVAASAVSSSELGYLSGVTSGIQSQINSLSTGSVPAGSIIWYSKGATPTGFLECNGAAISRTTYSNLYSVIGTTFGTGDGSTTFNLPDLRGEFIRGWDHARGIDASRTFGSWQDFMLQDHVHQSMGSPGHNDGGSGDGGRSIWYNTTNPTTGNHGAETRPRNIALLPCIKY